MTAKSMHDLLLSTLGPDSFSDLVCLLGFASFRNTVVDERVEGLEELISKLGLIERVGDCAKDWARMWNKTPIPETGKPPAGSSSNVAGVGPGNSADLTKPDAIG